MKTVKIDGVELTEEQIRQAVKQLEQKEFPPYGTLCYVWEGERPEMPRTAYSDGKRAFFYLRHDGVNYGEYKWSNWEPVTTPKIGISLWMATDANGKTYLYSLRPVPSDGYYVTGKGGLLIGFLVCSQTFNDEPLEIKI